MANKKKPLKKQKIRNSEYYDMQLVLDELYAASVKGQRFCNLVELIKRPENISWHIEISERTAAVGRRVWIIKQ